MSVQCNTYVMLGTVLPYESLKDDYEKFEPYTDSAFKGIHHYNGLCIMFDGMDGEYVAIGEVLSKSENWRGLEGFIYPKLTPKKRKAIAKKITGLFGIGDPDVSVVIFSHYR